MCLTEAPVLEERHGATRRGSGCGRQLVVQGCVGRSSHTVTGTQLPAARQDLSRLDNQSQYFSRVLSYSEVISAASCLRSHFCRLTRLHLFSLYSIKHSLY